MFRMQKKVHSRWEGGRKEEGGREGEEERGGERDSEGKIGGK